MADATPAHVEVPVAPLSQRVRQPLQCCKVLSLRPERRTPLQAV